MHIYLRREHNIMGMITGSCGKHIFNFWVWCFHDIWLKTLMETLVTCAVVIFFCFDDKLKWRWPLWTYSAGCYTVLVSFQVKIHVVWIHHYGYDLFNVGFIFSVHFQSRVLLPITVVKDIIKGFIFRVYFHSLEFCYWLP